ncbi:MAG: hypothetical protein EKK57_02565 [Proteobacteria bacterium]|nr:MAG: hypothetical protein EKK57_02565 [Pseudomonadota bacterium]
MRLLRLATLSSIILSSMVFADDNQPLELEANTTTVNSQLEPNSTITHNETLIAPPVAVANQQESQDFVSAWGVSVQGGTLGIGINLAHALYSDYLDIRGQYNFLPISKFDIDNNEFNVKFNTLGLLLDYKPFGGSFRFTGGMYYDNRSLTLSGNNIDIGDGMTASGSASINYPSFSPYLGIGIGSQAASTIDKKGFLINFDAGVMLAKATVSTNLQCNSTSAGSCDNFNNQVNTFTDNLDSGLRAFPFYPVLSLSLGYRF